MKSGYLFALLLSGLLLFSGPSFASTDEMANVLRRLDALENSNAILNKENAVLQDRVRRLQSRQGLVEVTPALARVPSPPPAAPAYIKAPPMADRVYNWAGLYIGAHFGAGWGTNTWSNLHSGINNGVDPGSGTANGLLGGGQIGYNYQFGRMLVGVEGEYTASDVKGATFLDVGASETHPIGAVQNLGIATVTGRIGAVLQDFMLLYVKGGYAWTESKYKLTFFNSVGAVGSTPTINDNSSGYVLGFGTEYRFDRKWSAKIEYNYVDFGTKTVNFPQSGPTSPASSVDIRNQLNIIKVGVNYTFN